MHTCVEIFWLCYFLYQLVFCCTYSFQIRIAVIDLAKRLIHLKKLQGNIGKLTTLNNLNKWTK